LKGESNGLLAEAVYNGREAAREELDKPGPGLGLTGQSILTTSPVYK
jgi:hypothetical protein